MKLKTFLLVITAFFIVASTGIVRAESDAQANPSVPDKALCAKMIRFGQESYERGKYLDAKEYFRKAIQADPTSSEAWVYYDQTVIFALAEKTEKNAGLLLPGTSTRHEVTSGPSSEGPPPPAKKAPKKDDNTGFKIIEDEGC